MEKVKLFTSWTSPFAHRAIWALNLKGIKYECAEETIFNKSPLLLKYNPVHKKLPVLLHEGKPICESMVIVEYIEETWPQNPLLPTDNYGRSQARFWSNFIDDKGAALWKFFMSTGEEQKRAMRDCLDMLRTIEEYGLKNKIFFGGDKIGLADIAFGSIAIWLGVMQKAVGVKFVDAKQFPCLDRWLKNFMEDPVIKANTTDPEKLAAYFKTLRQRITGH